MITNNPEIKRAYLPATINPSTLEALNEEAKKTGNRSFIVDKALRIYLGLKENPEPDQELKAS